MAAVIHDAAFAVISLTGLAAIITPVVLAGLYIRACRTPEHEDTPS
jgi:hypothetical protein